MEPLDNLQEPMLPRHRSPRQLLLVSALSFALALFGVLGGVQEAEAFEYTIKDGDTLQALAQLFYGDPRQWERIATANGGTTFRVGEVILIPEKGDPDNPGANVVSTDGEVEIYSSVRRESKKAELEMGLLWQEGIRTGQRSKAQLRLRDAAYLRLYPETDVVMLGTIGDPWTAEVLRVRVRLKSGAVELAAAPDSRVQLEVLTPRGMAKLEGGEIYFGVAGKNAWRVAVLEGRARFGQLDVPKGRGGIINPRSGPGHLVRLPPRLRPTIGKRNTTPILCDLGEMAPAYLSWRPIRGKYTYEAALFYEYDEELLLEARAGPGARAVGVRLPDSGIYRARFRAIAPNGLPGPWATTTFIGVVGEPEVPPFLSDENGVLFIGSAIVHFEDMPAGLAVFGAVDGVPTAPLGAGGKLVVAGVGEHKMNFRVRIAVPGERTKEVQGTLPIKIEPIPGVDVEFQPRTLDPLQHDKEVEFVITLLDGADIPVRGEAPVVAAGGRTCTAEPTEDEGVYRCTIKPRVPPGRATLPIRIEGRGKSFVYDNEFQVLVPEEDKVRVQ